MTKARDLSKLLSTSNGKIAGANLDVSFENISDTGTEGTKVASGTTAERGSTTGQWRFNSDTGFFEGKTASAFQSLEPTPTVVSVDDTEIDSAGGGNQTIVVTGTNFTSGGTISFVGSSASFNASSTTINSGTQATAVAPKSSFLNAQEPYKVKYTASSGLAGTSSTGLINVDNEPTWNTASGSLGSFNNYATVNVSATATDVEGETIVYSILSGSLPSGLSLNTSTGAITGTASAVGSSTTSSFTLRATANSKNSDRAFSIIVAPTVQAYSYSGSLITWNKPSGVSSITAYVWGAGGGGGSGSHGRIGGSGGYAKAVINVSSLSALYINVGQGGFGTDDGNRQGSGGGLSGIFNSTTINKSNSILIGGSAGGGAGTQGNQGGTGGGGGGANINGLSGTRDSRLSNEQTEGAGGTLYQGGSGANSSTANQYTGTYPTAGSVLQGGNGGQQAGGGSLLTASYLNGGKAYTSSGGAWQGGAGGSGYYGGGGGTCGYSGGGGGGSGYANTSICSSIVGTNGSNGSTTAPENSSTYYSSGIGIGGARLSNGGNGRIVLVY